MMAHHLTLGLALILALRTTAQTTSDCAGAIALCGGVYTESSSPTGTGTVYEYTGACNADMETSSLWYTFTVAETGALSFVLDPATDTDDYDWGLFNITQGGCADIGQPGGASPEVSCNSYGNIGMNGPTGIATASGGIGQSNGPGNTNGPAFNADLQVQVGETYALVVMNWSNSPNGYTIDFTQSTASIYDDIAPTAMAATFDCANTDLLITFSEPIRTSTVEIADFRLRAPDGNTMPFVDLLMDSPGAVAQQAFTARLAQGLTAPGTYQLVITSVADNVEDLCGNIVLDTLLQVNVGAPLRYTVDVAPACNAGLGTLEVAHRSGGVQPITFAVDGQPMGADLSADLALGDHILVVEDAGDCVITETITIPNHAIYVQIPALQDSLSCTRPEIGIQGVSVQPVQQVHYGWSAVSGTGEDLGYTSTSSTPTVTQAGTYTVVVTEPISGCTDQASVTIHTVAGPSVDLTALEVPNVVTPNGDGQNDTWLPYLPDMAELTSTSLFHEYQVSITDRWGMEVFGSSGGPRPWNAQGLADGTYYYTLRFRGACGTPVTSERTGSITVLR